MARQPKNTTPVDDDLPSKTQLKKEMHDLQALGEILCGLSNDQLKQLELPEVLFDALLEMQKLTKHEAIRRHKQYIGKLMREVEPEPIREQIDRWEAGSRANKAAFKAAELWRERLIKDTSTESQEALLQAYPSLNRAELETLANRARMQASRGETPTASRQLFRLIHRLTMKV